MVTNLRGPLKLLYDELIAIAHENAAEQGNRYQPPIIPKFSFVSFQTMWKKFSLLPPTNHHIEQVMFVYRSLEKGLAWSTVLYTLGRRLGNTHTLHQGKHNSIGSNPTAV